MTSFVDYTDGETEAPKEDTVFANQGHMLGQQGICHLWSVSSSENSALGPGRTLSRTLASIGEAGVSTNRHNKVSRDIGRTPSQSPQEPGPSGQGLMEGTLGLSVKNRVLLEIKKQAEHNGQGGRC